MSFQNLVKKVQRFVKVRPIIRIGYRQTDTLQRSTIQCCTGGKNWPCQTLALSRPTMWRKNWVIGQGLARESRGRDPSHEQSDSVRYSHIHWERFEAVRQLIFYLIIWPRHRKFHKSNPALDNKNSSGDEIVNVNFYAVRQKATPLAEITQNNATTSFKVIQSHRFWYQSKAHIRFPISD